MTILTELSQNGNTIKVEVLDAYEVNGVKFAAVKACEGQPFVGGDKWPVKTEFATVEASELVRVPGTPPNGKRNLLEMAITQARDQWIECQTVWLWGGPKKGAYLKAAEGEVRLNVIGYRKSLLIFWLDLGTGEWRIARDLEAGAKPGSKYSEWARKAREVVK